MDKDFSADGAGKVWQQLLVHWTTAKISTGSTGFEGKENVKMCKKTFELTLTRTSKQRAKFSVFPSFDQK